FSARWGWTTIPFSRPASGRQRNAQAGGLGAGGGRFSARWGWTTIPFSRPASGRQRNAQAGGLGAGG
ncbi:hypothetical protein C0U44_32760, partial [Klebsiella pneumoniae]